MFRPERLVRISIQVPEPFVSAATGTLARFKLLHLIRIDETHLGRLGYSAQTDGTLLGEFEALSRELESLLALLQVPSNGEGLDEAVIPEKDIFRIKERIGQIRQEVASTAEAVERTQRGLQERKTLLEQLALLPGELELSRLGGCRLIGWTIGLVPSTGIERLEESISQLHHARIELAQVQEQTVCLIVFLKEDQPLVEQALRGALFEPIAFPAGIAGTVEAMRAVVEHEIRRLEEEEAQHSSARADFQRRFGSELRQLRERLIAARQILVARRHFGKIDSSYIISGWIPERHFAALGEALERATERQAVFEKVVPEESREVRRGIVQIPILFNNPMLIMPFERLTSLYGTPRYREIEPTFFFALSFLLLFGMMFGDVGQGGVLFCAGYVIFRRFYRHIDYGIILMECGVSSILFGWLYGSVFGLETLIPPLWFRPMERIPFLIKMALSLGVALVSLGLLLNLINAVRLKEYRSLPGASGLAGALLYWMAAGLGVKYCFTGRVAPGELRILGWAATALAAVMIVHRPLVSRLWPRGEPPAGGLLTELIESVVELFDDLLRFVANTVSFIRVAAFALSHAALFIAVFAIADLLSRKGSGFGYWAVVAAGNIVIIFLEGMVVFIQTVRLEYYEFFGKFFRGGGERFRPFTREIDAGKS